MVSQECICNCLVRLRIICQVLEMASQECICNCLVRLRIICQVLEMVSQECICNCLCYDWDHVSGFDDGVTRMYL